MMGIIQARCPGCSRVLRMPADWTSDTLRCKHCGQVFQSRPVVRSDGLNGARQSPLPLTAATKATAPSPFVLRLVRFVRLAAVMVALCLAFGAAGYGYHWASQHPLRAHLPGQGAKKNNPDSGSQARLEKAPENLASTKGPPRKIIPADLPKSSLPAPETPPAPRPRPGEPHRLLAISIHAYLFANPIPYPSPRHDFHNLVLGLARAWRMPPTQVAELSDHAPQPRPPTRPNLEKAIGSFLDTSRSQDRVVLLFAGHALELEGKAYLVPIEGDPNVRDSLLSMDWLYQRLQACRARQKVLILDVCRFNPGRSLERPGGGPLGPVLDALLQNPPPAVQVWSACSPGQHSLEIETPGGTDGAFLATLSEALPQFNQTEPDNSRVEGPPSLTELAEMVNAQTRARVQKIYQVEQLPRVTGREGMGDVAVNPREPLPSPLDLDPLRDPNAARQDLVKSILDEVAAPSLKMTGQEASALKLEALPLFVARDLEMYPPDEAMTPLREAIKKTQAALVDQLKDKQAKNKLVRDRQLREYFAASANERQFKLLLLNEQKEVAKVQAPLLAALEELQKAGEKLDQEPSRRWQANFKYLEARLSLHLAFMYEYQLSLGEMRKQLPPRDVKLHTGWRLASKEKLDDSGGKKLAAEARKILQQLVKDHPRTPWDILARRDLATRLGCQWEAVAIDDKARR